jgi:hypothetical protein
MTMTKKELAAFDREIQAARDGEKRAMSELAKLRAEHSWCILRQSDIDRLVMAAEEAIHGLRKHDENIRAGLVETALAPFRKEAGR